MYLERTYEKVDLKKGGVEIGKAMAEKSKGLFSADDWQCKTYVNCLGHNNQISNCKV